MSTARLRCLQKPPLLRREQRRREIERGPPGLRERIRVSPPGGLRDVARAAPDLQDAAPPRPKPARGQALQERLAVSFAAERRMWKSQEMRDGALDLVEAAARRQ